MALNLSTLTSPATSGDVLAEALTTADFLESVPVLRNLARGSQKGGDAEQDVALNQPKSLPLIDGDGYLYLPKITGNYASVPLSSITTPASGPLDVRLKIKHRPTPVDGMLLDFAANATGYNIQLISNGTKIRVGTATWGVNFSGVMPVINQTFWVRSTSTGSGGTLEGFYSLDGENWTSLGTATDGGRGTETANELRIGASLGSNDWGGAIIKAELYNSTDGTNKVLDVDFTSTNVRHGDTKFQAAVGGPVSLTKAGNDPITVVKKSVLRFDGANSGLEGLFANNINGGYMFAAFSVLGSGGDSWGRVFTTNLEGSGNDYSGAGAGFSLRNSNTTDLRTMAQGLAQTQTGMFDDANGDILHEVKLEGSDFISKVNNAGFLSATLNVTIDSDRFNIGKNIDLGENAALDLEYLALFPSLTDAQADAVRNYINKRNNVFSLVDNSYYFFDPQKATFTGNFTAANTLDGYITGSDLGDTDVRTNLTLEQGTLNDQPSTDGYKITFNDSAEHLEFVNGASQALAGWQIVGTSLGTFAYRVNANAVTELNLLGNAGQLGSVGDSFGMLLLPESATSADIEQARKLLIDRGAESVGQTATAAWSGRSDVIEFKNTNFTDALYLNYSWDGCTNMTQIGSVNAPLSLLFTSAWRNCSSLTSFPADAKLGTEATNVNFTQAWRSSGLTSFPALDLSTGNNFTSAWQSCSALTSFPAGAKLGTSAQSVNIESAWQSSGLTSFSTPLPTVTYAAYAFYSCASLASFSSELPLATNLYRSWEGCSSLSDFRTTDIKNCSNFTSAFQGCSSLQSFPAGAKLGTAANNVNFSSAWRSSGLTSFSTDLPSAGRTDYAWRDSTSLLSFEASIGGSTNFYEGWKNCSNLTDFSPNVFDSIGTPISFAFVNSFQGCSALSADSVQNILSSIDTTGHSAPGSGPQITIDYNVATGSLSAATNSAVTSLKSKGWSIIVNNVTL